VSDKPEAPKPAVPPPPPAKAPPKNPGFVTFTVNGKEVVAKPGTNMIEAAKEVGVEIPYYCYHPRLSIAANCRMCLVEASNAPKLVPACQTAIGEGVAIKTNTQKVKDEQKAVMEFLLLNHPVDCSICDQAGECKLQDYYMRYDHKSSRLLGTKVLRNKRKVLGPSVVLDQERCILCTRCVRFMQEIPKEPQLGVFGRGSHERIDVFPESGGLTSNYSGNVVDICPVGALLNRDFRFRARAWFLSAAPSVCTGCSKGCSIWADYMGQDTYRYRPRENEQINKSWMCDQGRLTYKALNHKRLLQAVIGRGQDAREATRGEALTQAAKELKSKLGTIAVIASPTASNEDLMASLTFAKTTLGVAEIFLSGRADGTSDHLLMQADKNPNRTGLKWVAKAVGLEVKPFGELTPHVDAKSIKALYIIGGEVPLDGEAFSKLCATMDVVVTQATNESWATQQATVALPAATHVEDEGTFTQGDSITQRFRRAYPPRQDAQPHWKWAGELGLAMGGQPGYGSSREVWKAYAASVPELSTFNWDREAPMHGTKKGISAMPAAADGRPPGWRDVGVPRVRGI
jgi:NADH-quinone oxidoreductase subunit G